MHGICCVKLSRSASARLRELSLQLPHLSDFCLIKQVFRGCLKRIVDATGAIIILTSSWRINYWKFVENDYQTDNKKILDLYNHFEKYGFKVSGRTDYTERSGPVSRPYEIRKWLADKEDVENFCIIDDFYTWKWLAPFLVITRVKKKSERRYSEWEHALSDADVDKAIEILNRNNKLYIEEQF